MQNLIGITNEQPYSIGLLIDIRKSQKLDLLDLYYIPEEQLQKERWTHVRGYKGLYEVSTASRVRNTITGKILVPTPDGDRYMKVMLYKKGTRINHRVHILVAKTFKRNPKHKKEVNHKNKNRHHNWADNLEWNTRSENMLHCYRNKNK